MSVVTAAYWATAPFAALATAGWAVWVGAGCLLVGAGFRAAKGRG